MNVREYLQEKYSVAVPTTMTKIEAQAFGIPYPLRNKWLRNHGNKEVSNALLMILKGKLEKCLAKQERKENRGARLTAAATRLIDKANKKHKQQVSLVASDDFLRSYEWRMVRMVALKRHGARCQCCGASAQDGVRIHVDHIKPRRLFPLLALDPDNLQVLCEECNHGKGNWDATDWRYREPNLETVRFLKSL